MVHPVSTPFLDQTKAGGIGSPGKSTPSSPKSDLHSGYRSFPPPPKQDQNGTHPPNQADPGQEITPLPP